MCCRNALHRRRVVAWDFKDINAKAARYWRDVGTLDAYYEANMDLIAVTPGVQSVRSEVAHPNPRVSGAAGEIRLRAGRPAHGPGGGFDGFARLHCLRRAGEPQRAGARLCA